MKSCVQKVRAFPTSQMTRVMNFTANPRRTVMSTIIGELVIFMTTKTSLVIDGHTKAESIIADMDNCTVWLDKFGEM